MAINRGATVRLLLATSGDKGTCDPSATRQQVAALLEGEARDAASLLGTVSPSCSPTIPNTLILPTWRTAITALWGAPPSTQRIRLPAIG